MRTVSLDGHDSGNEIHGQAIPAQFRNLGLNYQHPSRKCKLLRFSGGGDMLWTIFAILLILWLLGFGFHVAGSLIHLLLVVAVVVLLIELITGRRTVV